MSTPFDHLLNFRDIARSTRDASSEVKLKDGFLFRSARPDEATPSDQVKLTNEHRIRTFIDLRTTTEHIEAAKVRRQVTILEQSSIVSDNNAAAVSTPQIPGVEYAHINLNGRGFERSLVWRLSYYSLARFLGLMALGYRLEAISIISEEIMLPRGLIGLGIDTLDHSQPELKQVFDVLNKPDSWPVMIHCTQGKDRTGIVVLLILMLCGVDQSAISRDYFQSEQELKPEMEDRIRDLKRIGLDESFAQCAPELPMRVAEHIDRRYGGIHSYLTLIGIDNDAQERLRITLIRQEGSSETSDCQR